MPDKRPSVALIWHEAGNPLYADRFRALGAVCDLTVFGLEEFQGVHFPPPGDKAGYRISLFKSLMSRHWLTFLSFGIIKEILRGKFDLLYVHEEPHSLTAFLVALLKGKRKLILDVAVINRKGNFKGLNPLEAFVYSRADGIFCRNDSVADVVVSRGGPRRKLLGAIGNGVSFDTFTQIDKLKARKELIERFPLAATVLDRGLVLGYAGRIWEPKGLRTFESLMQRDEYGIIMCGEVVDEGLATWLQEKGVYLFPKLKLDELRLFYASLDLFILPSIPTPGWVEQFGRVLIEAVASGTPAMGSDLGAIPEIVGKDATFEPGNAQELDATVHRWGNPAALTQLLERQRVNTQLRYSWDAIAGQVMRAFSALRST